MFILGGIVAILTFPGIIVHEFSHQLFCILTKTKVLKVCYFQVNNPSGYVIHEVQNNPWKNILICFGPFLFNSLIALSFGFLFAFIFGEQMISTYAGLFALWLLGSIGMHSFPSFQDAGNIWKNITEKNISILPKIVGIPIVGLIYIGSFCSIYWLDAIYGYTVAYYLPRSVLMY